jgi:2-dehydro-3-deoxyphosphogalactonate aldolase
MNALERFTHAMAELPLVAILRGMHPGEAESVGRALVAAGWRIIEVPLTSPQALQSIAALSRSLPEVLVGAGTVLQPDQVREVHEAGGRLIVAPNFDAGVVREAVRLGMACLPGVLTPTEAFAALATGATGLKLFPAEMISPPAVKALRAVLPSAPLLPVGGIHASNMAAYRDAGATGFGIGSTLYRPGVSPSDVQRQAMELAAAWRGTILA